MFRHSQSGNAQRDTQLSRGHDAALSPLAAQFAQRVLTQQLFGKAEDNPVLQIKFLACKMHDVQQPAPRVLECAGSPDLLQSLTNGVVLALARSPLRRFTLQSNPSSRPMLLKPPQRRSGVMVP